MTLPFVVRAVQPVLLELDQEMEEAARSLGASSFQTFRRIVLPNLMPAILSGAALSFGKAVGEFGSIILISGNIPFDTEVASVNIFKAIESDDPAGAAAVSVVLLAALAARAHRRRPPRAAQPEARCAKYVIRYTALTYLALVLVLPLSMILFRTFQDGLAPVWAALTDPLFLSAFKLTLIAVLIAVPLNTVFGVLCAIALVRRESNRGEWFFSAAIGLPLALSPIVVGLALILVYGNDGWIGSSLADLGIQIIFSTPGIVLATIFVTLPFVVREVIPVLREIGTDQEEAAWTLGRVEVADLPADHAARRSAGASRTASSSRRRGRSASTARSPSCRVGLPARRKRLRFTSTSSTCASTRSPRTPRPSCSRCSPSAPLSR